MNTEIISHPKLQHYGLITANLGAMIDWGPLTCSGRTVRVPEAGTISSRSPFTTGGLI